jgi:hypothetical protein
MKRIIVLVILISTFLYSQDNKYYDQFSVGIGVNNMQSATFIKDIDSGSITYGFSFFRFANTVNINDGYEEFASEISANIYLPRLGYKKNLGSFNRINTHALIEGYLIYPTLDINVEGDQGDTDDLEKDIVDFIDLFGMKASYGIEYKFNDQFSLSTNVGFNFIFHDMESSYTDYDDGSYYNNYQTITNTIKTTVNTHIFTSFTSIALNFRL